MVIFLHRLLRQTLQRVIFPNKDEWDSLKDFYNLDRDFLTNEQFMVKTSFKDRALTVVQSQIDVVRSKTKMSGSRGTAATLGAEKYNPFVDACRDFIRQTCLGLLSLNTWKSDLVFGLASLQYTVLFCLPKSQSLEGFTQFFKNFGDREWVDEDMRSKFKECYIEFVKDLWYVQIDDRRRGPEVEDMITFLNRCPELEVDATL